MSMRRPTMVAAKLSDRSACARSPRTDCWPCATSAFSVPWRRVATSVEYTRCRSRSRTPSCQRLAVPSAGTVTRPVTRASPARRASTSSSASSRPFQRKREFNAASGTRAASSAPASALVATSVPAKPSDTASASRVTDNRVAGSAGRKRATLTSFAAMCAPASGATANGVSVALAVIAASRVVPDALTANFANDPLADTSARVSPNVPSPVKFSAAFSANGATAASSASPASVPKSLTKRKWRTTCVRAPPR